MVAQTFGSGLAVPLAALLLASVVDGFGGLAYLRKPTEDQMNMASQLTTEHAGKGLWGTKTGTTSSVYNMPVSTS